MITDTDVLAQKLYDGSLSAKEVKLENIRHILAKSHPGHDVVDTPEKYRFFVIDKFPVRDFGITLDYLKKEAGSAAKNEEWKHDRILDLWKKGEAEWPAIVTASGIVIDGYHRIAAHGTRKDKTMSVLVAVRADGEATSWDTFWNEAYPF